MRTLPLIFALMGLLCPSRSGLAFGFYDATGNGLAGGSRWDDTPRVMDGLERSLDGGLRFSLQGGSYAAFRNLLTWAGTPPSASAFEGAVLEAFAVWTSVDPATGLGTTLRFVPDLATAVDPAVGNFMRYGSEIDIFASTDAGNWNPGNAGTQAETYFSSKSVSGNLRLTSGTVNYPGYAISGADITFNSNAAARWTLTTFRTILAHEIGHALGLADVDVQSGPNWRFVDNNYDDTNPAGTLMDSFALRINPLNPGASQLAVYFVANGVPGLDSPGVDILMESAIPDLMFTSYPRLANDDFAGRQFLYPVAAPIPSFRLWQDKGRINLAWDDVPYWVLETSTSLAPETWTFAGVYGEAANGQRTVVWNAGSASMRFFRLRRTL